MTTAKSNRLATNKLPKAAKFSCVPHTEQVCQQATKITTFQTTNHCQRCHQQQQHTATTMRHSQEDTTQTSGNKARLHLAQLLFMQRDTHWHNYIIQPTKVNIAIHNSGILLRPCSIVKKTRNKPQLTKLDYIWCSHW